MDDLDDFIDSGDDIERDVGGGPGEGGVSESMLQEHLDIIGTDFVEFMGDDNGNNGRGDVIDDDDDILDGFKHKKKQHRKYRERRVGVDYGVDSGKEVEDDSDIDNDNNADLFGEDNIDQDIGDKQHAEVLRLKRKKTWRVDRVDRQWQWMERVQARRRAALCQVFEPVKLVKNFCTERNEAIRMVDCPERYYDWLETTFSTTVSKKQCATLKITGDIT